MMNAYDPRKYCHSCKNPITRFEPNPRFLSCKHLMCDKCYRSKHWLLSVTCPCGVESSLPVPETEVFPKLDDSWDEMLKMDPAKVSQIKATWNNAIFDPRSPDSLPTKDNFAPLNTNTNTAAGNSSVFGNTLPTSWEGSVAPRELGNARAHSSNAPSVWALPSSSTAVPAIQAPSSLQAPPLNPSSFPVQPKTTSQFPPLKDTLRVIDPRNTTLQQVAEADEITSRRAVQRPEKLQSRNVEPRETKGNVSSWSPFDNNNVFGGVAPHNVPQWKQPANPRLQQSFGQCRRHSMTMELWCDGCETLMCGRCVLDVDHPVNHVATLRPHPGLTANRIHDSIQVLNDHSQAIRGCSAIARYFELGSRQSLLGFVRDFIRTMEHNRNALRDYERQSAELAASSFGSFPFDVTLDRPSKVFDEYIAVKIALDKMVVEEESKKDGDGASLLVKLASMVMYQVFRSTLVGNSWATAEKRRAGRVNAATNTIPICDDPYAIWLGTLRQRAELARKMTDPNAIIPTGWFVNTLPNVFFIEFTVDKEILGRVLIETNPDIAPVMSANFALLCNKARYLSYKNCTVFQCWPEQSIITGDNESNNGNGGKCILNDDFVVPDETGLVSFRGAVGMRRLKKRISKACEISSQFRITLKEMKGITGIFGRVVKGIEIVEEIAQLGDTSGNPTKRIWISDSGRI